MVEWKKLGEIANITIGEFVHRDKQNPKAKYPVYNGGTTYTGFYEYYNNTGNKIVISARGYAGFVNRVFDNYWAGNSSYSIDISNSKVLWHFVYYYLKNEQYNIMSMQQKGGGLAAISKKQVQELLIPIPSLSEQQRIVSILDTFTSSISNLKQQIEERRKQYEYERDLLLDLEGKEGVEMKKLGEVCEIKNGYTPSTKKPEFWENGSIPWFTLEDIRKNGRILSDAIKHITPTGVKKSGLFPQNSIIVSTTATIGEYALITRDFLCNQQISCISVKEATRGKLLPKYLYYLSNSIGNWCKKNVNGGGSLLIVSTSKLNNLFIPLPSLSTQSRIVSILDTFEQSIANLEEQLAMREKQYEYYRNQLLTFE